MANLQVKSFQQLVQDQVTAIQGGSSSLVDLTIGSILRSIVEAYAAVAMWVQGMILQLLSVTRAATSSGSDLDSWVYDYGLERLAASYATGQVTFSRFTATASAAVPVDTLIQSADGTQQYSVVADSTNIYYSSGRYTLPAGIQSITVPVQAVTAGSGANAAIAAISVISQALTGIDTVTNQAAFINGADAESDTALRSRFIVYIGSLSKATKQAVGFATTSLQSGISYTLVENEQLDGTTKIGYFYLVVDDGTGYPTSTLLASVYNAVDAVRPLASTFGVFAPTVVLANIGMTISTDTGYDHAAVAVLVSTALTNYINSLPLGSSLAWTRLSQVAYDASAGVINVSAVLINSDDSDLSVTSNQVIKAGTVAVA